MPNTKIQMFLSGTNASSFKRWNKGHGPKSSLLGQYDFETITDEWFKWYLTRENGQDNVFLFQNDATAIYFVETLPFQKPYFKRFTMKLKASLLVPIYSFCASTEEYPSIKSDLINLVKKDLSGIRWNTVRATFDGQNVYGYCVIRDKPLPVDDVKSGNSKNLYHGGFWLLIEQEALSPGDHLLYLRADSKTYETEAKILINAEH